LGSVWIVANAELIDGKDGLLSHLTSPFCGVVGSYKTVYGCQGKHGMRNLILAVLILAVPAFPQSPAQNLISADSPFQVRYAANLNIGESYIDITNTGANRAGLPAPGPGGPFYAGNICVNVYAFDAGEEMISCCSCLITTDETVNLGVNRDLTVKTLTGVFPTSVSVKLLTTLAGSTGDASNCTNSAAMVTSAMIVGGMAAWGTTLHSPPTNPGPEFVITETPFSPATLNPGELVSLGGRCASILGNGSTFGVCQSCRNGALGAQNSAR
jgi:hypothetical protein